MWDIVICESDEHFAGLLTERLEAFYGAREFETTIRTYSDGHSFMDGLDDLDQSMDLVFLDTKLSDMSGFVAAELLKLSERMKNAVLIFIGDRDKDVFQSFFYQPFWYIRKKEFDSDFEAALNRLWVIDHRARSVKIRQNRADKYLRVEDIIYIETEGHNLKFHCVDGCFHSRARMAAYEERLKDHYFVHPSKSYLINCAHVDIFADQVIMKDGSKIPCSKAKTAEAKKMRARYIEEIEQCL